MTVLLCVLLTLLCIIRIQILLASLPLLVLCINRHFIRSKPSYIIAVEQPDTQGGDHVSQMTSRVPALLKDSCACVFVLGTVELWKGLFGYLFKVVWFRRRRNQSQDKTERESQSLEVVHHHQEPSEDTAMVKIAPVSPLAIHV